MTKVESIDDVTIRLATNDDGERIRALVFGVLDEFDLPSDPAGKDADLNDIESNYLRSGGVFEVIEDKQGTLVGTYGLYPLDKETVELRRVKIGPVELGPLKPGHFRYLSPDEVEKLKRSLVRSHQREAV